jgi:hypothetical protein
MAAPGPEKLRHLAICLPLAGLFLLMPPALLVFSTSITLFGIPLIVVYLFGVWGTLIACAAALARYLGARDLETPDFVGGETRAGSPLGEERHDRSSLAPDRAD